MQGQVPRRLKWFEAHGRLTVYLNNPELIKVQVITSVKMQQCSVKLVLFQNIPESGPKICERKFIFNLRHMLYLYC